MGISIHIYATPDWLPALDYTDIPWHRLSEWRYAPELMARTVLGTLC